MPGLQRVITNFDSTIKDLGFKKKFQNFPGRKVKNDYQ